MVSFITNFPEHLPFGKSLLLGDYKNAHKHIFLKSLKHTTWIKQVPFKLASKYMYWEEKDLNLFTEKPSKTLAVQFLFYRFPLVII